MQKRQNKTKKQWAAYNGNLFFLKSHRANGFPLGVGFIAREDEKGKLYLIYSENKAYQEKEWHPKYIQRFETPQEASSYLVKKIGGNLEKELEKTRTNFPKRIKTKEKDLSSWISKIRKSLYSQKILTKVT